MISIKNKFLVFFTLIIFWTILAYFNDPIILPSPKIVFLSLIDILRTKESYQMIASSFIRVLLGLAMTFLIGIPLGVGLSLSKAAKELVMPLIKFLQGTPVISWILLALIWLNIEYIPIFILLLNSLPILTINIYEGIMSIDKKLLEMSKFYKVSNKKIIKNLYIPSTVSHIVASSGIILSSSFKIVVMAEIITKISSGVGSSINYAWINIETEKILAWTLILVSLSMLIDFFINKILKSRLEKYYA